MAKYFPVGKGPNLVIRPPSEAQIAITHKSPVARTSEGLIRISLRQSKSSNVQSVSTRVMLGRT